MLLVSNSTQAYAKKSLSWPVTVQKIIRKPNGMVTILFKPAQDDRPMFNQPWRGCNKMVLHVTYKLDTTLARTILSPKDRYAKHIEALRQLEDSAKSGRIERIGEWGNALMKDKERGCEFHAIGLEILEDASGKRGVYAVK